MVIVSDFVSGNDMRLHALLKYLTAALFFSSDNFQPFTSFTSSNPPNITITGNLFFLGILSVFYRKLCDGCYYFHLFL